MDSYDILVILLSVMLAVFLIIGITLGILIIRLVKQANKTSEILHESAEDIHQFTSRLKTIGDMSAIGSAITQFGKIFKKGEDKK